MVDVAELEKLLRSLGQEPSKQELARMVADLEIDGNQTLEFPDFLKMISKQMKDKDGTDELREAFKVLDEDGNGFVRAADLTNILVDLLCEKPENIKGMIADAKVDKDGNINFEEFIRMIS